VSGAGFVACVAKVDSFRKRFRNLFAATVNFARGLLPFLRSLLVSRLELRRDD
jgi:hypothetical protein